MSIKVGNLEAIAYHLEQGCDNGDITRDALALFLRGVADEMEQLTAENERLKGLLEARIQRNRKLRNSLQEAGNVVDDLTAENARLLDRINLLEKEAAANLGFTNRLIDENEQLKGVNKELEALVKDLTASDSSATDKLQAAFDNGRDVERRVTAALESREARF